MSELTTTTSENQSNAQTSQEQMEVTPGSNDGKRSRSPIRRYPNNLGQDEQPHSVNFFISEYVPGASSKRISDGKTISEDYGIGSARSGNELTAENAQNIENLLGIGASFTGAVLAQETAKSLTKNSNAIISGVAQVGAAYAGAAGTKEFITKNASSLKSSPAIRIQDAISLHIPQSPQAKYGAQFENESIGTILGLLSTTAGNGTLEGISKQASQGNLTELVARGMVDAATIPKELGLGDLNFGGLARAASKKVRNPYQEQIFKTMNFRSFAFQYKFAPRNNREFDEVIEIINLFKFHMHPEKANDGAFFTFPSVFDIEYRYKGSRNTYVNKIATSVLTDLSVDYGSEGVFTTFRGTGGKPSEITIAMQFREISLLTKDRETGGLTNGSGVGY